MGKNPGDDGRLPNGSLMMRMRIEMGGVLFQARDNDAVVVPELDIGSKKTVL